MTEKSSGSNYEHNFSVNWEPEQTNERRKRVRKLIESFFTWGQISTIKCKTKTKPHWVTHVSDYTITLLGLVFVIPLVLVCRRFNENWFTFKSCKIPHKFSKFGWRFKYTFCINCTKSSKKGDLWLLCHHRISCRNIWSCLTTFLLSFQISCPEDKATCFSRITFWWLNW